MMRKRDGKTRRRLSPRIAPVMLLLGMFVAVSSVHAADEPQFGIRPANPTGTDGVTSNYFTLKTQAGETLKDAVVIANPGTVPIKVALYPVDATSGQGGGAIYMGSTEPRKDVGAWITLETPTVEIQPQKQTTVSFTVTVPTTAYAGQHLGGIAAQLDRGTSAATQQAGSFGVTTVTRALTAVLVNVGEVTPAPSLRIMGAQIDDVDGLPTLTLSVQNDGTTLVKSHGDVTVTDASGKIVLDNQFTLDTLVPQTTIAFPVQADPPATPGTYKVRATLDFGGDAPAVYEGPVVVTARPTAAPAAPSGRARPTPAAAVAASEPAKSGGISPLVAVLSGIVGAFAVVMVGLIVLLARSRKRPSP